MLKYENGIHVISNNNYHGSEGVSRSRLMSFHKSPQHYLNPKIFKGSPAMALGSLTHCLLLEPELFDKEFAIVPVINKRTKIGKEQWAAFELEHSCKTLVTDEQIDTAKKMCASIMANEDAANMLSNDPLIENSIYWTSQETGMQFKSRPDIWYKHSGLVVDLKTTADASPWSFSNSAWKFGYFMQAAFAKEALASIGEPMTRFVIIAVENTAPFVPAVYVMDEQSITFAVDQFHRLARDLKACIENNAWPDFGVNLLSMPRYAEGDSI